MSEKLSNHSEHHERHEQLPRPESESRHEHRPESVEHQHKVEHQPDHIEKLEREAQERAKSKKETQVDETENKPTDHHLVSSELKTEALQRGLRRVRKHLSPVDKGLSKIVHAPVVDAVSKVGEKTIARPKGILTGSIVALIGSSWVLYSAKHYGFSYNYWIVLILFVGGYAVGLILELVWFAIRRSSN